MSRFLWEHKDVGKQMGVGTDMCVSTHTFPGRNWKLGMRKETRKLYLLGTHSQPGVGDGYCSLPFTDEKTEVQKDIGLR